MSLSPREKWIHYFSLLTVFGFVEKIPKKEIMGLADVIRQERCRDISEEEAVEMMREIQEETMHGQIAMDELMQRMMEGRRYK
jgi:ribosomal protein S13|tara:strand:+ start:1473 stop:1721 length:249 start_codon:yes stop_codon:yes gene_type:complete